MSKIYISGKISGLNIKTAEDIFFDAALDLYYYGEYDTHEIINPFNLTPFLGIKKWWCYMITDLYHLRKCDTIFMLHNWKESRGACIEHLYAVWTKKKIIYQQ